MPPSKDVVKIAVQMMGAIPQLIELNQAKPLSAVVKEVCEVWNLNNSERYALQYVDGQQAYITELNRGEIKNGSILQLTTAPTPPDTFNGNTSAHLTHLQNVNSQQLH
ncbi:engulfment and cell motility protein 3-like [Notechis scutatus]|uniref:Engulfment and cell motility protein 3-like n=1 Tax=Notechis scutatus TaxID=8663 RepID=A0A6J1W4K1_9SAUR|nr:engulfment and cell motility protein 3-like [Notechis scutatus]